MQEIMDFFFKHQALFFPACIVIVLLLIVEFIRAKRGTFNINPLQMTQLINHQNAVIMDVRDKSAYQHGHIIDAINLSASEIMSLSKKIEKFKTKPLIIVCNNGIESQKIAAFLLKHGYNAYSLAGGMRSWLNAQMPIIKEAK